VKKVLIMVMALVVLMPITNVFAYSGGMLGGKPFYIGTDIEVKTLANELPELTNGVLTDYVNLMSNGSDKDTVWHKFDAIKTIDAYQYKGDVLTDVQVRFYGADKVLLWGETIISNNVKVTIPSLPNVAYVGIVNTGNVTRQIQEFDVWGTSAPETIQHDSVTLLSETHTYGSANLTWANPTGTQFTGTIIKQNGIEVAQLANTSSSYSITGLTPDTLYSFEVIAKYSDGINSSGQTVSLTTDSAPLDSTAPSNITNVQVVKSDELASFMYTLPVDTDFSHLKIYRDGELKEVAFTGTSYDDFSLVQNTTYVYKFVSVDLSGNESNGFVQSVTTDVTVDSTAPNAPLAVEVTNGASSGAVKWDISSESDTKGYNVYVDGVKHNTVLIMANSYVIPNLVNEQSYLITVTTVDTSDNESVPSIAQTLIPTSQAMPFFEAKYDLKDVADGTSQWFGSMWLILAFSVGIPLAFLIARRVKGLLLA
jgi:hypothetical protein